MPEGVLDTLAPPPVWRLFEAISRVPRCSGSEEHIRAWILAWTEAHGVPAQTDGVGNVLLSVSASPGCEMYPTCVLQAHLDMVCAKEPGVSFDFGRDPIKLRVDDGWIAAAGTTLGADNGIGLALALATLIEPTLRHGPLEALFTVNEENGFTGALGLQPGFFSSRYMLNLDTEDLGQMTVASAGAEFADYVLEAALLECTGERALELAIQGLQGGHSGLHIHLPRASAIKLILEGLRALVGPLQMRLCRFEGGSASNAIPSSARCTFLVPSAQEAEAKWILSEWRDRTLQALRAHEPQIQIAVLDAADRKGLPPDHSERVLTLLDEVPQGPLGYSQEVEGLVETSCNLGIVQTTEDAVKAVALARSSLNNRLDELSQQLRMIGAQYGAHVRQHDRYPGWIADSRSPFNVLVEHLYAEVLQRRIERKAYHAGLECGVFKTIAPDLEVASIGPTLAGVHSTAERVEVHSVGVIWEVIRRVLERMDTLVPAAGNPAAPLN